MKRNAMDDRLIYWEYHNHCQFLQKGEQEVQYHRMIQKEEVACHYDENLVMMKVMERCFVVARILHRWRRNLHHDRSHRLSKDAVLHREKKKKNSLFLSLQISSFFLSFLMLILIQNIFFLFLMVIAMVWLMIERLKLEVIDVWRL